MDHPDDEPRGDEPRPDDERRARPTRRRGSDAPERRSEPATDRDPDRRGDAAGAPGATLDDDVISEPNEPA